jgi:hypothetical protein
MTLSPEFNDFSDPWLEKGLWIVFDSNDFGSAFFDWIYQQCPEPQNL